MKEHLYTLKFSTDVFELTPNLLAIGRYASIPMTCLPQVMHRQRIKKKQLLIPLL